MKLRTATAVLGLVVATGGAAAGSTAGTAPVQTTERVQKAIQCVTEGADPRCVSQNYALSLDRGTNSTGTAPTILLPPTRTYDGSRVASCLLYTSPSPRDRG